MYYIRSKTKGNCSNESNIRS